MAAKVTNTEASTVAAVIMNMMIICSLAAWWTEDPPRIAPVIIPGIAMIPMTLRWMRGFGKEARSMTKAYFMLLIVGISANFRAWIAIGLQASSLVAPNAK